QREFPHVQVVALPRNLGFAAAVNRGIAASRGEFICLLNNDTEADERFVEEQVKALKEDALCGSTASKILWFHRRDVIQSAGDRYWRGGEVYWAGENRADDGKYDEPGYVFSACAAGAVYRRKFFEEAGFFDESFHSYQEDVDLGFRGNLFGFRCRYVPAARLYHMVAQTGSKNPLWAFQTARNELSALLKNMPASMLRENCRLLIRVQKERIASFNHTPCDVSFSKGKIALLLRLPGILRQRAILQRARCADLSHLEKV
ncbi:MAG: glycosyltransferase, partial [Armatimonadetes bacterium]|nr:glycosyltransferase [Armatimonadota bacterium]NIM22779.1 glycosyltransferase [Armatimonadota bacterium]NIM66646.1 glycosyltransferase [Armatimonadota bacterium]NIM75198.1 glycosyltransferase [Armatimonadota bacterium]NIN04839.1 glycosyltransferase [Armatimonadota bacterium]